MKEWSEYDRGLDVEFLRVPQGARAVLTIELNTGEKHIVLDIGTPEWEDCDEDMRISPRLPLPDRKCHLLRFRFYPFGQVPLSDDSPFKPDVATAPEIEDEIRSALRGFYSSGPFKILGEQNNKVPAFTQITTKYLQMMENRMQNVERQYEHARGFTVGMYVIGAIEWLCLIGMFIYVASHR